MINWPPRVWFRAFQRALDGQPADPGIALHFALTEVKEMAPRTRNLKRDSITLLGLARLETCRWKKELKEEMVLILN